jgi:hypothetical protein
MQKRQLTRGLLALIAAWMLTPIGTPAATSNRKGRKQPVDKGSAETRAERDKRLQRECRGKPNAGACEGYGG